MDRARLFRFGWLLIFLAGCDVQVVAVGLRQAQLTAYSHACWRRGAGLEAHAGSLTGAS